VVTSSLPVVVAQPDEKICKQSKTNRTTSVLEWYDRHRAYSATSGSNEEELFDIYHDNLNII